NHGPSAAIRSFRSLRGSARSRRSTTFMGKSVRGWNESWLRFGTVVKLCCSILDRQNNSNWRQNSSKTTVYQKMKKMMIKWLKKIL
ncbi:MAG: hypothetical protein ACJ8FO_12305, partial [Sphingomicrobium sp.]